MCAYVCAVCVSVSVTIKLERINRCEAIAGTDVRQYENETQLLQEWTNFIQVVDPDIITGYNIVNFDLPYLLNRARTLKVSSTQFQF